MWAFWRLKMDLKNGAWACRALYDLWNGHLSYCVSCATLLFLQIVLQIYSKLSRWFVFSFKWQNYFNSEEMIKCIGFYATIAKNCKAKKIQISFSFNWIPSNVWVAFTNQQRTTLQSTSSQVANNLNGRLDEKDTNCEKEVQFQREASSYVPSDMVSRFYYSQQNHIIFWVNQKNSLFLSSLSQTFPTFAMHCKTLLISITFFLSLNHFFAI